MHTAVNYAELYLADSSKSQEDLEKEVRDYPVSSAARFLLLYLLKKNDDPNFDKVAKQTGNYLYDPYWMEFQLSEMSTNQEVPIDLNDREKNSTQIFKEDDMLPVEKVKTDEELSQPVNEEMIENSVSENREVADQGIGKEEPIISHENEVGITAEKENDEELPRPVNEEIIENSVSENQGVTDQDTQKEEPIISHENEVGITAEKESDELPQPVNEEMIENSVSENQEVADQDTRKEEPIISHENEVGITAEKENDEELPQPVNEEIMENPVSEEENIPFEPLHTVDYFASQGIKLSEEALNNDQLGRQVKSFTAWLKSMKKLHPGQLPEQNEVIERLIQTSSEASNQNANVLTEAMAEVLVKQGKKEKAIEMYQKLSLINPSKSAYFAAKIESLKII